MSSSKRNLRRARRAAVERKHGDMDMPDVEVPHLGPNDEEPIDGEGDTPDLDDGFPVVPDDKAWPDRRIPVGPFDVAGRA